jgi:hypothetical protein
MSDLQMSGLQEAWTEYYMYVPYLQTLLLESYCEADWSLDIYWNLSIWVAVCKQGDIGYTLFIVFTGSVKVHCWWQKARCSNIRFSHSCICLFYDMFGLLDFFVETELFFFWNSYIGSLGAGNFCRLLDIFRGSKSPPSPCTLPAIGLVKQYSKRVEWYGMFPLKSQILS